MHSDELKSEPFIQGLKDYFYLINKNYPEKGSLKIVGDRYKLSGDQRTILYRGISPEKIAEERIKKLTARPSGSMIIDGYNVLFTLLNYRLGRFVFICNDNICRDAGSLFGKVKDEKLFKDCTGLLVQYLSDHFPELPVRIYLDIPVSSSKKHFEILTRQIQEADINCTIIQANSADEEIKRITDGTLATSDSVIIDQTTNPIFDLPRAIIETQFKPGLPQLIKLIAS